MNTKASAIRNLLPFLLSSQSTLRSEVSPRSRITKLHVKSLAVRATRPMESGTSNEETARESVNPDGKYNNKLRELVHDHPSGGWEKSWELGITPWDLGGPTPIVVHLHQTGSLPNGRALVPGCGTGYDVVAMACPERYVVGLDISESAVKKATQMFSSVWNAGYFTFLSEDFFTWRPTELFDLIFDYTFFCAIEPHMRPLWAQRMQELLKEDGELITLMFPIDDHEGGPPYKVSVSDYEEILLPLGFKAVSIEDNELAVKPRKGAEKLGRWKRSGGRSTL